jgi:hypothetical protein
LATDKRLRKGGNPVAHSPPSGQGGVGGEVAYLAAAHRALIDQTIAGQNAQAPRSYWKWLEEFYANNKGLIWVIGVAVTFGTFALHFFMG